MNYQAAHVPNSRRRRSSNHHAGSVMLFVIFALIVISGVAYGLYSKSKSNAASTQSNSSTSQQKTTKTTAQTAVPATTVCTSNSLSQNIIVSISKRHLWACAGTTVADDAPVVTGMEKLAADLTPTGTYHIYSKQTNLSLKGSDSTGSWDDPVSYWMPFLSNQYGIYGFHDATWRANSDFGNIDPYSSNASHGCVELPLATAKWLYNWSQIGTTVTIQT
jgi:lipoprotein-anchoring transpeptidase ErfK/SrfK